MHLLWYRLSGSPSMVDPRKSDSCRRGYISCHWASLPLPILLANPKPVYETMRWVTGQKVFVIVIGNIDNIHNSNQSDILSLFCIATESMIIIKIIIIYCLLFMFNQTTFRPKTSCTFFYIRSKAICRRYFNFLDALKSYLHETFKFKYDRKFNNLQSFIKLHHHHRHHHHQTTTTKTTTSTMLNILYR